MAFLDRIRDCNNHDLTRYLPLLIDGRCIGYLRRDRVEVLAECSANFRASEREVQFLSLDTVAERSRAIDVVVRELHRRGELVHRLGEKMPVMRCWGSDLLFELERAAVPWFGVGSYGVHLNGFVHTSGGLEMWVAVRAGGRSTFAGKLDNLVAGGQPAGISLLDNLHKECLEEAGIDLDLAQRAVPAGMVGYCAESERGLKPDTIFCYDLELADDFVPLNLDGEVECFHRWPIAKVAARVRDSRDFKFNCNLVIIDFLLRHGYLKSTDEDFQALSAGLWQPLAWGAADDCSGALGL